MTKMLCAPNSAPYQITPATTRKLAQRMLSASREVAAGLSKGFYASTAMDILLTLHIAEDDAQYLTAEKLHLSGDPSIRIVERWLAVLIADGLVDQKADLLALSAKGYSQITAIIEAIYVAQRALDEPYVPETSHG